MNWVQKSKNSGSFTCKHTIKGFETQIYLMEKLANIWQLWFSLEIGSTTFFIESTFGAFHEQLAMTKAEIFIKVFESINTL